MIDALVGLFIVAMGAVSYYSLLPVVHRSQEIAQQESKAAQMAARVAEQVGMLKPSEVTATTLKQMQLIDETGAQPWSFTSIPMDDGTCYSPAKVLRNGQGSITTSSIGEGSILVTVRITWKSPTGKDRSFTTGTVVGGYK